MVGQNIMQTELVGSGNVAQFGHGLQIRFFKRALFDQTPNADLMRGGIGDFNLDLRNGGITGPAVQGVNLPVSGDRMSCPLIATAHHHLVETIQPAETVAALKIDICRINDLFNGRIPPQSGTKAFYMQKVHPAGRAQGNCQAVFTADYDDFAAFLFTTVQDFLLNAERLVFNFQLITGNLPVPFSTLLSALVSTQVLAAAWPEISTARSVKANLIFIFYPFC